MILRVVIVEDEVPLLRELLETFSWRSVNCKVCGTAGTVAEARQTIAQVRPDILITDIQLPDGDGISLLEETNPRAAIVITGYGQVEFAQKALRAGAVDFLLKPIDDDELRRAVQRAAIRAGGGNLPLPTSSDTSSPLVHDALIFIQKHFGDDVSLFEAARHLGITEGHLAGIFKQQTGKTFVQALTEHRMTVAGTLLRDPRQRISEVARHCGYNDAAYFAKVFRRTVGLSPREYRNRV
jgi:two-component system, response regulator YesN